VDGPGFPKGAKEKGKEMSEGKNDGRREGRRDSPLRGEKTDRNREWKDDEGQFRKDS